jgi:hypothetical protein
MWRSVRDVALRRYPAAWLVAAAVGGAWVYYGDLAKPREFGNDDRKQWNDRILEKQKLGAGAGAGASANAGASAGGDAAKLPASAVAPAAAAPKPPASGKPQG